MAEVLVFVAPLQEKLLQQAIFPPGSSAAMVLIWSAGTVVSKVKVECWYVKKPKDADCAHATELARSGVKKLSRILQNGLSARSESHESRAGCCFFIGS